MNSFETDYREQNVDDDKLSATSCFIQICVLHLEQKMGFNRINELFYDCLKFKVWKFENFTATQITILTNLESQKWHILTILQAMISSS